MSAEKSPLVNKLILLVLGLILACLIILIAQNSGRKEPALPTVPQTVAEENAPLNPPEPPKDLANSTVPKAANNKTQAAARQPAQPLPGRSPTVMRPPSPNPPVAASLVNLPPPSRSDTSISSVGKGDPQGAEIFGYVWLAGTPPPETTIPLDATCGRLHSNPVFTRHYVTTEDGRLADAFVYIKNAPRNIRLPIPTNAVVLDNVGCLFEPYVLGMRTGQTIQFRNSDPLMHNVHVATSVNREFNLALPGPKHSFERIFRVPEMFIRVKCDLHPWMLAYVAVVAHPFFAVTDREGAYRIPVRLPPGRYEAVAVHPKAGEVPQDLIVREGEKTRLDFTLTVPEGTP